MTVLDGATIPPALAARLALCALGHVLYLMDQIPQRVLCPFLRMALADAAHRPVGQLARLAARPDKSSVRPCLCLRM